MMVNPPEEWKIAIEREKSLLASTSEREQSRQKVKMPESEQPPDKHRTSIGQVQDKFHTDNYNIISLIRVIGDMQLSVKKMMSGLELKGRDNFLNLYLIPSITGGYVRLLYPDKPRHPRQKYLLTVKGMALYKTIQS